METILRIGEIAARAGVSRDTVRYYERLGLVPRAARTDAGYRQYPESALKRVRLVRNALQFGFSLREIGAFLRVRESGGAPCRQVRTAAERLLAGVEAEIRELTAIRQRMRTTLKHWDRRLAETPEGGLAGLLDALPASSHRRRGAVPPGRSAGRLDPGTGSRV